MELSSGVIWRCKRVIASLYLQKSKMPQMILSVQVHPNDKYALKHENELGKTELLVYS